MAWLLVLECEVEGTSVLPLRSFRAKFEFMFTQCFPSMKVGGFIVSLLIGAHLDSK